MAKAYNITYCDGTFTNCNMVWATLEEAKSARELISLTYGKENKFLAIETIVTDERLAEIVCRIIDEQLASFEIAGYSTEYNYEISFYMSVIDYIRQKNIGYDVLQKKFNKLFLSDKIESIDLEGEDEWEFFILRKPNVVCIEGHHGWNDEDGVPEDGIFGHSNYSVMDAYVNIVRDIENINDKELRQSARLALDKTMHKYLSE